MKQPNSRITKLKDDPDEKRNLNFLQIKASTFFRNQITL